MARAEQTHASEAAAPASTAPFAFAGAGIDRDAERRCDEGLLGSLQSSPDTRVLAVRGGRFAMRDGALVLRAPSADDADLLAVYLGRGSGGTPYVGVVESATDEPEGEWRGLRSIAAVLPEQQATLVATLSALANWHATHTHCPRCGGPTRPTQSGWTRRCDADDSEHFPRTDPAVIMAVVDDADRLLLARGAGFITTGMSVLAGFVEPGETMAAAVVREVAEEVGVQVDRVEYLADQPWPFPTGLMVGFRAHATTSTLALQEGEIEAARWFSRAELLDALAEGSLHISPRLSIARWLIEDWFGGPLDVQDAPLRR